SRKYSIEEWSFDECHACGFDKAVCRQLGFDFWREEKEVGREDCFCSGSQEKSRQEEGGKEKGRQEKGKKIAGEPGRTSPAKSWRCRTASEPFLSCRKMAFAGRTAVPDEDMLEDAAIYDF